MYYFAGAMWSTFSGDISSGVTASGDIYSGSGDRPFTMTTKTDSTVGKMSTFQAVTVTKEFGSGLTKDDVSGSGEAANATVGYTSSTLFPESDLQTTVTSGESGSGESITPTIFHTELDNKTIQSHYTTELPITHFKQTVDPHKRTKEWERKQDPSYQTTPVSEISTTLESAMTWIYDSISTISPDLASSDSYTDDDSTTSWFGTTLSTLLSTDDSSDSYYTDQTSESLDTSTAFRTEPDIHDATTSDTDTDTVTDATPLFEKQTGYSTPETTVTSIKPPLIATIMMTRTRNTQSLDDYYSRYRSYTSAAGIQTTAVYPTKSYTKPVIGKITARVTARKTTSYKDHTLIVYPKDGTRNTSSNISSVKITVFRAVDNVRNISKTIARRTYYRSRQILRSTLTKLAELWHTCVSGAVKVVYVPYTKGMARYRATMSVVYRHIRKAYDYGRKVLGNYYKYIKTKVASYYTYLSNYYVHYYNYYFKYVKRYLNFGNYFG